MLPSFCFSLCVPHPLWTWRCVRVPVLVQTDAVSALNELPDDSFTAFNNYTMEWKTGPTGHMQFARNGLKQFFIDSRMVEKKMRISRNGTYVGMMYGRIIPQEPSYLILNTDMSTRWVCDGPSHRASEIEGRGGGAFGSGPPPPRNLL